MRVWGCICLIGLWASFANASPALPGDIIGDLNRLQTQLREAQYASVVSRATQQATRLQTGNAADRWASALYQQLAANALAHQGQPGDAANRLAQARELAAGEQAQVARWLREEVSLRHAAGQTTQASDLLAEWLESQDAAAPAEDYWKLTRWLADDQRWQEAGEWLERSLNQTAEPDATQRRLALVVYQRTQQTDQALDLLLGGLDEGSDGAHWREAAGLAQQSGQPGIAAALWDTAWKLGRLDEDGDRWQLIHLHMAGGTPARAAEYLETWLESGDIVRDETSLRLLANAWHQARDRTQALDAWQALATLSKEGSDWRQYGQLAFAWGQDERAEKALSRAQSLGDDQAGEWLATLEQSPPHSL